jgi:hypothetical protein
LDLSLPNDLVVKSGLNFDLLYDWLDLLDWLNFPVSWKFDC